MSDTASSKAYLERSLHLKNKTISSSKYSVFITALPTIPLTREFLLCHYKLYYLISPIKFYNNNNFGCPTSGTTIK